MASSDAALGAVDEPPQARWHGAGAYYVAAPLEEVAGAGDAEVVARACARCGQLAGVVPADAALAESCAGVLCTDCSGTASGILYIPSHPEP